MKCRKVKITNTQGTVFRIILEKDAWKTPGTSCFSFARRVKYELIDAPVGISDRYIQQYIESPLIGAIPWQGRNTAIAEVVGRGYFLVAVYRGLNDSHFIRLCSDGWYQTMGTTLQTGQKVIFDDFHPRALAILTLSSAPKVQDYRFIGFWIFPFSEDYDAKDKARLNRKSANPDASEELKLPPIVNPKP